MSERLYELLLRFYPRDFRDHYGAEMLQLFRDRLATEPRFRLWLNVLVDLAHSLPREHFRQPSGVYRESRWKQLRSVLMMALLTTLGVAFASLTGPLSQVIYGVFILLDLALTSALIHVFLKPLEYKVDADGIRLDQSCIRAVEISRIVEEPGNGIVVFGTNGAQIPIWPHLGGYKILRAQLAAWSPIEVLPKRRIPGSLLYLGWVVVIVSTNPMLVPLGAVVLAAVALYSTLRPDARVQHPLTSRWAQWGTFVMAATILMLKVFLSRL
jgi:hypothetical protein